MTARMLRGIAAGTIAALVFASPVLAARPPVIWSAANPGGLAASVGAVAWAPNGTLAASGMSDRNVRIRQASNGTLVGTILQPPHTHGVQRLQFSADSQFLAVGNSTGSAQSRVYRLSDRAFLGLIVASFDSRGILTYAPDAQLASAAGGAANLSNWKVSELPVFVVTGSGYDKITTRFQLSPNGAFQTEASKNSVKVRRTSDSTIVATIAGSVTAFSPSSGILAAWTASPNVTSLYRTTDFALVRTLRSPKSADAIGFLSFTPSGSTLAASGYLPYLNPDGTWNQTGIIRLWRVADGTVLTSWDQGLSLAVTSGVAFVNAGSKLLTGVYDGTTIAATNPYP